MITVYLTQSLLDLDSTHQRKQVTIGYYAGYDYDLNVFLSRDDVCVNWA